MTLIRVVETNAKTKEVVERWVEYPALDGQAAIDASNSFQALATNEATLRQQADDALASLRVERDRSYTGLSAAAAVALIVPALKLVIQVQIKIIRLLLRKLESTT